MTLVVAHSLKEYLRIVSDSKKTSPEEILRGTENSILKAVVVHPELCICFAGSVGRAQVAIEKLRIDRRNPFDLEQVFEYLLSQHRVGSNDPDFIVAALSPTTTLNRISGGELLRNLSSCWIGNYDAFCDYQKHFHATPLPSETDLPDTKDRFYALVSRMEDAFRSVIRANAYEDVGEFTISVMRDLDGLKYAPAANTSFVTQSIPSHTWTTLRFGSTAEGGHSYSIMTPLEAGIGAVGVHFYQGSLGALFYPLKSPSAIVYRNVSADQFRDKVREEFDFEIEGVRIG